MHAGICHSSTKCEVMVTVRSGRIPWVAIWDRKAGRHHGNPVICLQSSLRRISPGSCQVTDCIPTKTMAIISARSRTWWTGLDWTKSRALKRNFRGWKQGDWTSPRHLRNQISKAPSKDDIDEVRIPMPCPPWHVNGTASRRMRYTVQQI